MKKIIFACIAFVAVCLFMVSCGPSLPIQEQKSFHDLKENLSSFPLQYPDRYLQQLDNTKFQIRYYITTILGRANVQKTGYSIRVNAVGTEPLYYKSREFRGIYLPVSENSEDVNLFSEEMRVMPNTTVMLDQMELTYSAFGGDQGSSSPKSSVSSKSNENKLSDQQGRKSENPYDFEKFYVYFIKDENRYSITYSEFTAPTDKNVVEILLRESAEYFKTVLQP